LNTATSSLRKNVIGKLPKHGVPELVEFKRFHQYKAAIQANEVYLVIFVDIPAALNFAICC
jgi:hypothetical protein